VSIRGFNGRYANKLLVLVDGRREYTMLIRFTHNVGCARSQWVLTTQRPKGAHEFA
jgi:hypothetical protein